MLCAGRLSAVRLNAVRLKVVARCKEVAGVVKKEGEIFLGRGQKKNRCSLIVQLPWTLRLRVRFATSKSLSGAILIYTFEAASVNVAAFY